MHTLPSLLLHRVAILTFTAALVLGIGVVGNASEPIQLASDPALSPDGSKLAFEWRGDIWLADSNGGSAQRLTTDSGRDSQPHFSPDGSRLAFVSNRTGSSQIYVMPVSGGVPTQVTHHSEGYRLHDWFPDGTSVLASGSRDHHWRGSERLLRVRIDRRVADEVLADATATDAALDRKGRRVLFVREGERWWRKGYQGERAAQVWLLDLKTGSFEEVLHEGVDCRWPLWQRNGKAFYFTKGDSSGFGLWRHRFEKDDETPAQQHELVDFEDDSVVFPSIARDSGLIVFRHLFDLYRYQPGKDEQPTKIELTYAGDPLVDPDLLRREFSKADEVSFADDGLEMVLVAGGDLWAMDTVLKEPHRLTATGSYESSPVLQAAAKDAKRPSRLFVVARRDDQIDIWQAERAEAEGYWWQPSELHWTQLTSDAAVERDLRLSPDGRSLYFVRGRGELLRLPLDGDATAEPVTIVDGFDPPDYDISPCSGWVAYAQENDNFNSEIWIRPADASQPAVNISQHPDNDRSPRFSPDGTLLAFTARRADSETDIHYVYLQADEAERTSRDRSLKEALEKMKKARAGSGVKKPAAKPAESATKADETKSDEPDEKAAADEGPGDEDEAKDEPDSTREPITIDFEKISERVKPLSVPEAGERGLFWIGEKAKLAFHADIDEKPATYTVTFPDELKPKKLTDDRLSQPRWTKAAKGVLSLIDGVPALVDETGKITRYGFTARQELSQGQRLRDGFEVAWETMRDRWYDERLGGRVWAEVRRKYLDMAERAGDVATLGSVIELMLGELNGSHNGFSPRSEAMERSQPWVEQTAHLGVRFVADDAGPGLLVRDVLPGGPADRVESRLKPGDRIEAIDGTAVDPAMDLTERLNGRLDRDIVLTVQRGNTEDEGDAPHETLEISLRPISYGRARDLLYDAWLEHNRQLVDAGSEGRFGYLHIRGMNLESFYEFERQLYQVGYGKEGLVIDVRDNGGGFTTDLLLTALTQPRHAITVPRGGGRGYPHDRMVYAVWQKPIVVLCNQNSYSNAEIFSHAIKTLGRGKLVGVETAGGVISTGAVSINDVGTMRMPFRGWFLLGSGEDMEMHGAVPDHILWPQPGELPQGVDRQLEKAVSVLTEEIADTPPDAAEVRYATQRDASGR
jgi:tricorn protease